MLAIAASAQITDLKPEMDRWLRSVSTACMMLYMFGMATIVTIAHKRHFEISNKRIVAALQTNIEDVEPVLSSIGNDACPQNISVFGLKSLLDPGENITVVDVRSSVEYQQGHPEGSINVPAFAGGCGRIFLSSFLTRLNESVPNKGSKVFILSNCLPYTFDCLWGREHQVSQMLCGVAYTNVSYVKGGIEEWRQSRLPPKLGL